VTSDTEIKGYVEWKMFRSAGLAVDRCEHFVFKQCVVVVRTYKVEAMLAIFRAEYICRTRGKCSTLVQNSFV
jgi:hypothetical protein